MSLRDYRVAVVSGASKGIGTEVDVLVNNAGVVNDRGATFETPD